ncbi:MULTISPECIES: 16S rRNA (cytosine(967)-C(5))-methyltransferase RsmB [unclassified Wenzhouxiangella]|uniref:16S rRNA (cytosine(967)-C(5))-methyltransferase RsmB n=1 Tax=unclassified Wenzhouxiangella TaxID=2613841 RepID=UPI000E32533F|nr:MULTISPECIES: 16S rRNA (cytosine(967)-C(5))-methyltransferase RsmB [unclassified Wenzhouxiangella]RFF27160.1 16S rRNA (cytosine(967)-C(5))-methyltransferase RsmB [Wenzhouxiangella sp. 15181]RFP69154.1 16S rRNA (cytosine(967)-C(5))-methyltransferase RsmB [Wenzhouxiangella sp. 15190]
MKHDGSESRQVAAQAVMAVLDGGRALDTALTSLLEPLSDARDRALARRLSHGVLRDWPALDWLIGQLVEKPLKGRNRSLHFLLAVALHELRDGREPDHAVVHAAVAAARTLRGQRLTGLVNGVLRNFGRRRDALLAELPDTPVVRFGYPGWLVRVIEHDHGAGAPDILTAGNAPPPLWLRVNRRRIARDDYRDRLVREGIEADSPDGFHDALVLAERMAISHLPGFEDGLVSIQDGAAQRVADDLDLSDGQRVLDACAAPGGKTAHILERADVELTALDIDGERLARVGSGLERLGLQARLVEGDAARPEDWWDGRRFDRILVDAPCSGTGVIRRHPDIRWLRRSEDIDRLAETQRAILDALWPLLEPDGILVYATCSILRVENDEQARAFLERHADAREIDNDDKPGWPARPGRQILPGEHGCDGFYYFAARRLPQRGGD